MDSNPHLKLQCGSVTFDAPCYTGEDFNQKSPGD